jgi:hypothetical protein
MMIFLKKLNQLQLLEKLHKSMDILTIKFEYLLKENS